MALRLKDSCSEVIKCLEVRVDFASRLIMGITGVILWIVGVVSHKYAYFQAEFQPP